MQHIIKKQIIHLKLDETVNAFRVQHLMSEHYWKNIVPILAQTFDATAFEDEVIQINSCEINLGIVSIKNIEQPELSEDLQQKIIRQFKKILSYQSSPRQITREAKRLSIFKQWFFYMQNGYLPWNTMHVNDTWYQNVLETLAVDFVSVQQLRQIILKKHSALNRIIFQHPEKFLVTLAEILTAEKQTELPTALEEIYEAFSYISKHSTYNEKHFKINITKQSFKRKLWIQALYFAAKQEKNSSLLKLVESIITSHFSNFTIKWLCGELLLQKGLRIALNITEPILKKLSEKVAEQKKENQADEKIKEDKLDNKVNVSTDFEESIFFKTETANDEKNEINFEKPANELKELYSKEKTVSRSLDEEGIFIQHAGIVLLHPFLSSFFTKLNLINEGRFIDNFSHQKALLLLHFLATGVKHAEEYDLVIEKILCEYALQEPVETEIEFSEEELSEVNYLLDVAIEKWEILKGTSHAGLREGFLQRNGKLFTKNGSFYLQVEKSAIDVLLDKLPWNLSIIKLPWMNEILRVEWR